MIANFAPKPSVRQHWGEVIRFVGWRAGKFAYLAYLIARFE